MRELVTLSLVRAVVSEMDDELSESDRELRRPLFASPSPENNSNATEGRNGERNTSTMNDFRWNGRRILAVMMLLVLVALISIVAPHINGDWSWKGFQAGKTI